MDDKEIDEVWMALYKQEHYLMPFASGEYMVYHHDAPRLTTYSYPSDLHYEIIRPKKFRLRLYYADNKIELAKDKPAIMLPYKRNYVEIPMQVKLEDYFEIKEWRGRKIPIALKRFETEYKVERLFNLFAFT